RSGGVCARAGALARTPRASTNEPKGFMDVRIKLTWFSSHAGGSRRDSDAAPGSCSGSEPKHIQHRGGRHVLEFGVLRGFSRVLPHASENGDVLFAIDRERDGW